MAELKWSKITHVVPHKMVFTNSGQPFPDSMTGNERKYLYFSTSFSSRINSSQMRFLRPLSGVTLRDRIKSEKIRKQWKVVEVIDDIQNYQQK